MDSKKYLDSYIVFVYKYLEYESIVLKELQKYEYFPKFEEIENEDEIEDLNLSNISNISLTNIKDNELLNNIRVISSDVCGLGKSFKIKKLIMENNEKYYHFPLGGKLTKNIIYQKIFKLFNKIKKEAMNSKEESNNNNEEYFWFKNVAIHLDLLETRDISLINEFLFSFCITKFYKHNENIIYIPDNIHIYIELPNSSENYLNKFSTLNVFYLDNIKLGKLLPLDLNSNIRRIFKILNGIETNEEIEKFIKENIGMKEYTYYHINIFIKLYLSQIDLFDQKIISKNSKKENIIRQCIKHFIDSTKNFTNRRIKELIMENAYDKIQFNDIYENDSNKKNKMINTSYKYLERLKTIFNLPNDLEKDINDNKSLLSILEKDNDHYVLTEDNYKKMILLFCRIKANIPVIIMGETGCGKTTLIYKLSQIFNNGEKLVETINIYPTITDRKL